MTTSEPRRHDVMRGHCGLGLPWALFSNNLSLNEAIYVAENRPLWRLMSTFVATHS